MIPTTSSEPAPGSSPVGRSLKLWPELLAIAAFVGTVVALAWRIRTVSDGHFGYCLDDAYIHLAVAKDLVLHHVWGVTSHEFSSSTSSPLWVALLAVEFLLQGVNTQAPLLLSVLAGTGALLVAGQVLRRRRMPQHGVALTLLAIVFLTPLPTVALDGMEHVLHILLVFVWIAVLDEVFHRQGELTRANLITLCVVAPLLTACRYESFALILVTCGMLFLRRQRQAAIAIGLCSLSSVALFGAFSRFHGWPMLPASVLVKATPPNWQSAFHVFETVGGRSLLMALTAWHISIIVGVAGVCLWRLGMRSVLQGAGGVVLVIFLTILIHLQFGQVGWFFRYEAYLVASGMLVIALSLAELRSHPGAWRLTFPQVLPIIFLALAVVQLQFENLSWFYRPSTIVEAAVIASAWLVFRRWKWRALPPAVIGLVGFVLAVPLAWRGYEAVRMTPGAAKNIYDQQWQMGRFLRDTMGTDAVALGDIGATSFLSNIHLVDLSGLGSLETAEQLLHGGLSRDYVAALSQVEHVQLAVIYDRVFGGFVPRGWQLIGKWKAPDPKVTLGDTIVSFYSTNPARTSALARRLVAFSRTLPRDVQVSFPAERAEAANGSSR